MYKQLFRPFLFCFKPETAHKIYLALVRLSAHFPGRYLVRLSHRYDAPSLKREVFGLEFRNPVGLAAGFDFNGDCFNELSDFGFSFLEIGSLSSEPQDGGPKPRLFRYRKEKALINRLEARNKGVRYAIDRIQARRPEALICANLTYNAGSRKDDEIANDYQTAFSLLYDFVDMFTVNVSRPNPDGLLEVQDRNALADIIDPLLEFRLCYEAYKPILVKVSPDTPAEQLDEMLDYCMLSGIDGVVASDTTRRIDLLDVKNKPASGYLSGAPLFERNLAIVKHIHEHTLGRFSIVACGGIMTPEQAAQMLDAGASLIQLHTGLVFEGPRLVKKILKYLANRTS
jgi:dihydroorotate dehydrogenase